MNKKIIKVFLVAVLLFILSSNGSASSEPNGFRGWAWGTNYADVQAYLEYKGNFLNTKAYERLNEDYNDYDSSSSIVTKQLKEILKQPTIKSNNSIDKLFYCFIEDRLVLVLILYKDQLGFIAYELSTEFDSPSETIGEACIWRGEKTSALLITDNDSETNYIYSYILLADNGYFETYVLPVTSHLGIIW